MIPRVLVIAGSDSGGGAGIQADIKTITMLGGHAMTAITAVTAQNTLGVTRVDVLPADAVVAQIDAVVADIGVDAVKIGMLGSAETALAVADRLDPNLERHRDAPAMSVVVDPVMVATSGAALTDPATVEALEFLMRRATVVTPNVPELEALTGRTIATIDDLWGAATELAGRVGAAVLAKGGHLEGADVTDVLVRTLRDGAHPHGCAWSAPRIDTRHSHGTGCTLASAIACRLAAGVGLSEAVVQARDYVRAALLTAPGLGGGHGPMGHGLGRAHFPSPSS